MFKESKAIFKVASLYITTIIGAGFASGQELMQFFTVYKMGGFYGVFLSGILFSLVGGIVLGKVYENKINSYEELLFPTVGYYLGRIIDFIITFFTLAIFCVMVSGISGILNEHIGISYRVSAIIIVSVCFFLMMGNIDRIVFVSSVFTPIVVLGIIFSGFFISMNSDVTVFYHSNWFITYTRNWFFSSISYVGYNSLVSIIILCKAYQYLDSKKTAIYGGVLGGLLLSLIAILLNFAIYLFMPSAMTMQQPILEILIKLNDRIGFIYQCILVFAMIISAITTGYCFIEGVNCKTGVNKTLISMIICILAVYLSELGFSSLIAKIYPLFGYLGLFTLFTILISGGFKFYYKQRKL